MKAFTKRLLTVFTALLLALGLCAIAACGATTGNEDKDPLDGLGDGTTYTITVKVLNPDGTPNTNAKVQICEVENGELTLCWNPEPVDARGVSVQTTKNLNPVEVHLLNISGYEYDTVILDQYHLSATIELRVAGNASYTVNVKSVGGGNVGGAMIAFYDPSNTLVRQGTTSTNGTYTTNLNANDYRLEIVDLPAGYSLAEGNDLTLSSSVKERTIYVQSAIINGAAPAGTSYGVGDVMYDFTVQTGAGKTVKLSQLVAQNKAVVLNFWATWCEPCRDEFPAIQSAYNDYSDKLALLAISIEDGDSISAMNSFFNAGNCLGRLPTFDYACAPTVGRYFNTSSVPVTVCVDRYGVIIYMESGKQTNEAVWKANFAKWTADDYVQNF